MTARLRAPVAVGVGVAAVAAVALACGDIAAPVRDDLYEWRLIVPSASGPDTLNFHWEQRHLPVRVWAAETDIPGFPDLVQRAVDTWEAQFIHGEFRGELVSDSSAADVIVRGIPAPAKAQQSVRRLHSALAPECGGATDVEVNDELTQVALPFRIYIDPRSVPDAPGLAECLALTTIHEMGHAIGIFAHSPTATDIMYAFPEVDLPSGPDRETVEAAYHLPSTLEAVRPGAVVPLSF
jgi:predicted Zn-dependent protease